MRTYRLRFLGSTGWIVAIAILTLPLGSLPAFLYLLCNFQIEASEGNSQAR